MRVHRIVVAHGAGNRCTQSLAGSGSLMLDSELEGLGAPFTIGHVDRIKGFVHVLDDTTLGIVLRTLDTISDFVRYLTRKERFLLGATAVIAAGEEELLAYYLQHTDPDTQHDFIMERSYHAVALQEGLWEQFCSRPERHAQLKVDQISYSWDALIGDLRSAQLRAHPAFYVAS